MLGAAQPETGLHHKAGISKCKNFICRPSIFMRIAGIWAELEYEPAQIKLESQDGV
jgi:hypothetical protein